MVTRLTYAALTKLDPCGLDERKALFGRKRSLTAAQALEAGASIPDLLWVAGRLGRKDLCVRFALACAQRTAHLNTDPRVQGAVGGGAVGGGGGTRSAKGVVPRNLQGRVEMTMRRFGARWRDATTPREVLDIFKVEGCYEVLLRNWKIDDSKDAWADGLDIADDGSRHPSFELTPRQARGYRQRNSSKRQSWVSLPKAVRECVVAWLEAEA